LLADEPTGNLDSVTSASIVELLLQLNADGATIVVVTHDRGLATRLGRTIELLDGSVVGDGAAVA
jgi:putative ABC transport system ATP-binding protein